ncbi:uncharacterized protein E0L32_003287 [Thyridium curvatum]|uniref:Uncharacterized protein n=1 Tax=Thyridium curvatum TaxID=1093900 RepID=A0A507BIE2_9PEZI|nr:uncharacterized protein E0L32_003287 [Thyridium curvatum]TPX17169.1 hypothetical protein E0L32_003287 [Thyridium curvatum]
MGNAQSDRRQHYPNQQPQTTVGYDGDKDDRGHYRHAQQQPQPQQSPLPRQQPGYNLAPQVVQQQHQQHGGCYRSKGERRLDKALYKAERRVEKAEYKAGRRIERAEHRAERRAAKCCGGHSRRCRHDGQFVVSSPPPVAMGPPPARAPVYPQQQDSFTRREVPSAAEAQASGVMPPAYEEVARDEKSRTAFTH